jgi:hypothetical protein
MELVHVNNHLLDNFNQVVKHLTHNDNLDMIIQGVHHDFGKRLHLVDNETATTQWKRPRPAPEAGAATVMDPS